MFRNWSNSGTTLAEVLLAISLGFLLMAGSISVYWSGSQAFAKLSADAEAQYSARSAMQEIGEDIRSASAVEVQADGTELKLWTSGQIVRYFMDNNQMYRSVIKSNGTSTVPIAENVSQLSFEVSLNLVTIGIGITVNDLTYHLSSSVYPRLTQVPG